MLCGKQECCLGCAQSRAGGGSLVKHAVQALLGAGQKPARLPSGDVGNPELHRDPRRIRWATCSTVCAGCHTISPDSCHCDCVVVAIRLPESLKCYAISEEELHCRSRCEPHRAWAPDCEGNVPGIVRPGNEVEPAARWEAADPGLPLALRRQDKVLREVHNRHGCRTR